MCGRRERKEEEEKRPQKKKKFDSKEAFQISRGATVLTEAQDIDLYRPRTKETKIAYEGILNIIQKNLGDQPQVKKQTKKTLLFSFPPPFSSPFSLLFFFLVQFFIVSFTFFL